MWDNTYIRVVELARLNLQRLPKAPSAPETPIERRSDPEAQASQLVRCDRRGPAAQAEAEAAPEPARWSRRLWGRFLPERRRLSARS